MIDEKMGIEPNYKLHAPVPAMYMIGNSIELSLKSFLLHTGSTEDQLKSEYGHNLSKAFQAANSAGLSSPLKCEDQELEALHLLNDLYQSKQLNYRSVGGKRFPSFGPVQSVAKNLLVTASKEVGWRYKP